MLMNKKLSNRKGFTLILIVVAIIGILAIIIALNAFRATEDDKIAAVITDYKTIKSAVFQHYADTRRWPRDAEPGEDPNLMANNDNIPRWNGPYLTYWKAEHPWGGYYKYTRSDEFLALLFGTYYIICLELRDLGDRTSVIYQRLRDELGKDVVRKDIAQGRVILLIFETKFVW